MKCYYYLPTLWQGPQLPPQNPFLSSFLPSEPQFYLGNKYCCCIQIKRYISQLPWMLRMTTKIYVENMGWGFKESWLCFGGMLWKIDQMTEDSAAL